MKRAFIIMLALTMLIGTVWAGPLDITDGLEGSAYYPEESAKETAAYLVTYRYPMVVPQYDSDADINVFFEYLMNDFLLFTAPMFAEEAIEDIPCYTHVNYQVTCNDSVYFSVLFTLEQFMGAATGENLTAYSFMRQGDYAGAVLSLADIMCVSDPNIKDGLMYERATNKVNNLVYDLIWEIIDEQIAESSFDYYEGLTIDDLKAEFYPESDFYIDQDHNVVFFIQPAMISMAAAGVLRYTFSIAELMSEL